MRVPLSVCVYFCYCFFIHEVGWGVFHRPFQDMLSEPEKTPEKKLLHKFSWAIIWGGWGSKVLYAWASSRVGLRGLLLYPR